MVYIIGLRKHLCVQEMEMLFWVETVHCHYQLIGLSKMDARAVFFHPGFYRATRLSNVDLTTFTEDATYTLRLQS